MTERDVPACTSGAAPEPAVTIVVVQRESMVHTKRSLESVYASTTIPFDLLYVDAGSPPWIASYLRRESRRRGFRLYRLKHFRLPSAARNYGFARATTDYVVFLDNDVIVTPGWLEALLDCARQTSATIVGGVTCLGEPGGVVHAAGGGICRLTETDAGRAFTMETPHHDEPLGPLVGSLVRERVEMVEFHCMLVHADSIRPLFPLDEALETLLEFEDLSLRAAQAGRSIVFEPGCVVGALLPLPLPLGLADLPMILNRWNRRKNAAGIEHFRRKWSIRSGDRTLDTVLDWTNRRPYVLLPGPLYRLLRFIRQTLRAVRSAARRARHRTPC